MDGWELSPGWGCQVGLTLGAERTGGYEAFEVVVAPGLRFPHSPGSCTREIDNGDRICNRVTVTRSDSAGTYRRIPGVEGEDWETVVLQSDSTFWRLIRARGKQSTISLGQIKTRLRVKK